MARKKHSAEQIVAILRQIEVELANHKNIGQACKEAGINQQTYYRWRKEFGGLKLEQARRLKELEKENSRLRTLVTELSLEKQVLKAWPGDHISLARTPTMWHSTLTTHRPQSTGNLVCKKNHKSTALR
jgi:putative transposase